MRTPLLAVPLHFLLLGLSVAPGALGAADSAASAPPGAPGATLAWSDIGGGLAGTEWGSGGVTIVGFAPDSGALIAGVAGKGLFRSTDGGKTWGDLGALPAAGKAPGTPSALLFDPTVSGTFWVGIDGGGPGLLATTTAGDHFEAMGGLANVSSIATDLHDPKHKVWLVGSKAKERDLEVSTTGGSVFSRSYRLPKEMGNAAEVALVDAKTWLVGSNGQDAKDRTEREKGIWRSEDAGKTWTKVSGSVPTAHALVLPGGVVYWPTGDHQAVLRSGDGGKTWTALGGGAQGGVMPIDAQWMAAIGATHLLLSSDHGVSWDQVGPPLPGPVDGAVYDSHGHGIVIWHSTLGKEPGAIERLPLPADLTQLANPSLHRDLVIWDGDDKRIGSGWPSGDDTRLALETTTAHQGQGALQWHVAKKTYFTNAGWVWGTYPLSDKATTDGSGYSSLVLTLRLVGLSKDPPPAGLPTALHLSLDALAGTGATQSKTPADLLKACPKLADGQWHDVALPLADFGTDLTKLIGITLTANNGANDFQFDLFIDNIGLAH